MTRRTRSQVALAGAGLIVLAVLGLLWLTGAGKVVTGIAVAALTAVITAAVAFFVKYGLENATSAIRLQPPLSITIETNPEKISTFADEPYDVFVPTAGLQSPLLDSLPTNFYDWTHAMGGVAMGTMRLRLVVQATNAPVVLTRIASHVVLRRPAPQEGVGLRRPSAGVAAVRDMQVSLDQDDSPVRWKRSSGRTNSATFTLEPGEFEIFDISASLTTGAVEWSITVDCLVRGQNASFTLPHDSHLRTVAPVDEPYVWDFQSGWTRGELGPISTQELARRVIGEGSQPAAQQADEHIRAARAPSREDLLDD
jgi:hypothetical protein